jgi:hypothetical protein
VNRGIIQSAVTNKTLRLELEYRQPSWFSEGDVTIETQTDDTGLTLQYGDPHVSDRFACLLSAT